MEISKVAANWCQQQLQQRGEWFPFQLSAGGTNQPNPTMQSHQQIIAAFNNPNYNTQQRQQEVINILRANPNLAAAFFEQRKKLQQQQGKDSGQ